MKSLSGKKIDQLVKEAKKARQKAYAPYSRFKVGAALLLDDGSIIRGCNVENASYGLCICAERVAISTAVLQGLMGFVAMAVVTDVPKPASPCGACRQFMSEFSPSLPLILANENGDQIQTNLAEIFPHQFSKEQLDILDDKKKTRENKKAVKHGKKAIN